MLKFSNMEKLKILSFNATGPVSQYALPEIHAALWELGHEVQVIDLTLANAGVELLSRIMLFKPEIIITIDLIGLTPNLFFLFPGIKIVSLFFDNPRHFFQPDDPILRFDSYFVFSIDKAFLERKALAQIFYTPWCYSPRIFYKMAVPEKYDISFIGRFDEQRSAFFSQLADQFVINIWGDEPWSSIGHPTITYHGTAHPRIDAPRIYNESKIVISLNAQQFDNGISERLYNIMACGALALTNYIPVLKDHFEMGSELDTFKDSDELTEKLTFYLKEPDIRAALSTKGRVKVEQQFTYHHVIAQIMEQVAQTKLKPLNYVKTKNQLAKVNKEATSSTYFQAGLVAYNLALYENAYRFFSEAVLINQDNQDAVQWQAATFIKLDRSPSIS